MHHRNVAMLLRAEKLQRTPVHVSQTHRAQELLERRSTISLINRLASMCLLHVEADMVKVVDPVNIFYKEQGSLGSGLHPVPPAVLIAWL